MQPAYDPNESGFLAPLDPSSLPDSSSFGIKLTDPTEDFGIALSDPEITTDAQPLNTEEYIVQQEEKKKTVEIPKPEVDEVYSEFSNTFDSAVRSVLQSNNGSVQNPVTAQEANQQRESEVSPTSSLVDELPILGPVLFDKNPDGTQTARDQAPDAVAKTEYIMRSGMKSSLGGMIIDNALNTAAERLLASKQDAIMEAGMTPIDAFQRMAVTMAADLPVLMFGGGIPARGTRVTTAAYPATMNALRSVPIVKGFVAPIMENIAISGAFPTSKYVSSMAAMGFLESTRALYLNAVENDPEGDNSLFISNTMKAFFEASKGLVKGEAMGAAFAASGALSSSLMKNASSEGAGIAAVTAAFPVQVAAITEFLQLLEDPTVLPKLEAFTNNALLILGTEFIATMFHKPALLNSPVLKYLINRTKSVYIKNGTHPDTLLEDAHNSTSVIESLVNPANDRIPIYDLDGGLVPEKSQIEKSFEQANNEINSTSDLVAANDVPGHKFNSESPNKSRVPIQELPGVDYPVQFFEGDNVHIIEFPNGKKVAASTDYHRSLSMSQGGLMSNTAIVGMLQDLKIPLSLSSVKNDVNLEGELGSQRLGYFMPPELGVAEKIQGLEAELANAQKILDDGIAKDVSAEHQDLNSLYFRKVQEELDALRFRDLRSSDSRVVINNIIQGTDPKFILQTMTHEIGHVIASQSLGWEQGKGTGSSNSFFSTLSGYSGLIEDIFAYAPKNGISIVDLYKEAEGLSALWRPADKITMTLDPNRVLGSEKIADVVSILMNNPELIDKYAPNIGTAMGLFRRAHPESMAVMDEAVNTIKSGKSLQDMLSRWEAGDKIGEQVSAIKSKELTADADYFLKTGKLGIGDAFIDPFWPLYDGIIEYYGPAENALQAAQFSGARKTLRSDLMNQRFNRPLIGAGVKLEEASSLLKLRRIAKDPSYKDKIGPSAQEPIIAQQNYDSLLKDIEIRTGNKDIGNVVEKAFRGFYEARLETVIKWMEESELYSDKDIAQFKSNETYVKFQSLEHFIKDGPSFEPEIVKGGFGLVTDVIGATEQLDMFIIEDIARKTAKRQLIQEGLTRVDPHTGKPIFPVLSKEIFDSVTKGAVASELLMGGSPSLFAPIELPARVRNAAGEWVVEKQTWFIPKSLVDTFSYNSSNLQLFLSEVATNSYSDMFNSYTEYKSENDRKGANLKLKQLTYKALVSSKTGFVFNAVVSNIGFFIRNMMGYDVFKSATILPDTGILPYSGKAGLLLKDYPSAYAERIKMSFTGITSPTMGAIMEESIQSSFSRLSYDESVPDSILTDRLQQRYSTENFKSGAYWKQEHAVSGLIDLINAVGGRVTDGISNSFRAAMTIPMDASKMAAWKYMERHRAEGKFGDISREEQNIMIRTAIGAPPNEIHGRLATLVGTLAVFSKALVSANRFTWRYGVGHKVDQGMKFGALFSAAVVMGLMKNGAFDHLSGSMSSMLGIGSGDSITPDDQSAFIQLEGGEEPYRPPMWSDILKKIGASTLYNNFCLPLGMSKSGKGKVITLSIGQELPFKLIHMSGIALVDAIYAARKASPGDIGLKEVWNGFTDMAQGELEYAARNKGWSFPALNPIPGILMDFGTLALEDNIRSGYTGKKTYPKGLATGGEKAKAMLQSTLRNFAVDKAIADFFPKPDMNPGIIHPEDTSIKAENQRLNMLLGIPYIGKGFGVFYKEEDAGAKENIYRELEQDGKKREAFAFNAKQAVNAKTPEEKEPYIKNIEELSASMVDKGVMPPFRSFVENDAQERAIKNNSYLRIAVEYGKLQSVQETIANDCKFSPDARAARDYLIKKKIWRIKNDRK